jgi:hypothetical protein
MTDPKDLAAALKRAASASNATRIDHRDTLAAFGSAVVEPLVDWVRHGKHPNFVIRVFEAVGRTDPVTALAAFDEVAGIDRSLVAEVNAARQRLLGTGPKPQPRPSAARGTGVLDQVTPFGPPVASGDCMGITQKGEPCRNPGRYWVGDKLSCSRVHSEYR